MGITTAQRDRACGVLLGTAAGDALGAGYEFGTPPAFNQPVEMIGGGQGSFEPGEWTDDTAMAIAIAEVAATGANLREEAAQDSLVRRWDVWSDTAKDVGAQVHAVLGGAGRRGISARTVRAEAVAVHERTGRSGNNGSLMRTAPVALAYLDDEEALVNAARSISALTHYDYDARDACMLWSTAIRHAVLTGELDVRVGLPRLDGDGRRRWSGLLNQAEDSPPSVFAARNGWVVAALQAAWSAIATTPVPADDPARGTFRADHLRLALEEAVRGGHDTDTVAAIAGGLLGACYGASAVPAQWRLQLHGWPDLTSRGLIRLADTVIDRGMPDDFDYSYGGFPQPHPPIRYPADGNVWFGGIAALHELPPGVDAVISLCRVADEDLPTGITHLDVRLIDRVGENPNLDFVLLDTVRAIERLRDAGRSVFVHCVGAYSRTPTVAALYGARARGIDVEEALRQVCELLPGAGPNSDLRAALRRLGYSNPS